MPALPKARMAPSTVIPAPSTKAGIADFDSGRDVIAGVGTLALRTVDYPIRAWHVSELGTFQSLARLRQCGVRATDRCFGVAHAPPPNTYSSGRAHVGPP